MSLRTNPIPGLSQLPNGLTVISRHIPNRRSICVNLTVPVGSRHETQRTTGFSHLAEHVLIRKALRQAQDRRPLQIVEEPLGQTHQDRTEYRLTVTAATLPNALDLISRLLTSRGVTVADVEIERSIIAAEENELAAEPWTQVEELVAAIHFGKHPLGRPVSGDVTRLHRVTRRDLIDFIDRYYHPKTAQLTLVGTLPADLPHLVSRTVGKQIATTARRARLAPVLLASRTPRVQVVQVQNLPQAAVHLSWPASIRTARSAVRLEFLERLLMNYLTNALRERGLVYGVEVGGNLQRDFSELTIEASISPDQVSRYIRSIKPALRAFRRELTSRTYLVLRQSQLNRLTIESDDLESQAHSLNWHYLTYQTPLTIEDQAAIYEKTSLSQLRQLFDQIFRRQPSAVVVGTTLPTAEFARRHLHR